MQSSRAIVVTGQKSKDLWQMIADSYVKLTGGDGEFARLDPDLPYPTHALPSLLSKTPLWHVPDLVRFRTSLTLASSDLSTHVPVDPLTSSRDREGKP